MFSPADFYNVKISKVIISRCENESGVMSCKACSVQERSMSKTKENIINRKFTVTDLEYGIFFTSETGYFDILHVLRTSH